MLRGRMITHTLYDDLNRLLHAALERTVCGRRGGAPHHCYTNETKPLPHDGGQLQLDVNGHQVTLGTCADG